MNLNILANKTNTQKCVVFSSIIKHDALEVTTTIRTLLTYLRDK